jgi:hypothetical protein
MNDHEYDDGYEAMHPELIPPDAAEANLRIAAAVAAGIGQSDTHTFLKAWWAFAWLHPGFHPDDHRQWPQLPLAQQMAIEAFRRNQAGEIDGDLLYAAEATHNAVWLERCRNIETRPNKP